MTDKTTSDRSVTIQELEEFQSLYYYCVTSLSDDLFNLMGAVQTLWGRKLKNEESLYDRLKKSFYDDRELIYQKGLFEDRFIQIAIEEGAKK